MRTLFTSFFISLFTLIAPVASAQEASGNNLPFVYVQDVAITASSQESITGTFVAKNPEASYISSLSYDISVISPRPTVTPGKVAYDEIVEYTYVPKAGSFELGPKEEKTVSFSLASLPSIPAGAYRLRIQLVSADGRELDWGDAAIELKDPAGDAPFITLPGGFVSVTATDPVTGESKNTWTPSEGVNIAPNTPVTLTLDAKNNANQEVTGTVSGDIGLLLSQDAPRTAIPDYPVTIGANSTQSISVPITAPSKPGSYRIATFIRDSKGQQISGVMRYQLVVTGVSASIERLSLIQPATKAGESAEAFFSIVGPADRVETLRGTLRISVLDEDEVVGSTDSPITLTADRQSGNARVPLERTVSKTLGLRAEVIDTNGTVLATSTLHFPDITTNPSPIASILKPGNLQKRILGGAAILLLLIFLGTTIWHGYKRTHGLALLLVAAGLLWLHDSLAQTDGIQFFTCQSYTAGCPTNQRLFIYTKLNPSRGFQVGQPVNYDIRIEWTTCANSLSYGLIDVKTLNNGGEFVDSVASANTKLWTTIALDVPVFPPKSQSSSTFTRTIIGSYTFPQQQNDKTTLWTHAKVTIATAKDSWDFFTDDFRWLQFVGPTDLSLLKTGPATIELGSNATYSIAVQNLGPSEAKNVLVKDTIPAGLTFLTAPSSSSCNASATIVSCTIPSLAASATANLTLVFSTSAPQQCTPGSITDTATVEADNSDPVSSNNTSSVTTATTCPAPVTVNLLINGSNTPPPSAINTPITLSWSSKNADTCTASVDWTGTKSPSGSEQTTPTEVREYTYTIVCENTTSGQTGTDTASILIYTPAAENKPPVAVAHIEVDGQTQTNGGTVQVERGKPVHVKLLATGSSDPDGWDHESLGVSSGGKCQWNSDLNQGEPSYETLLQSPASPSSCDIDLGTLVFNDAPGTYSYQLLQITDKPGAVSTGGAAAIEIIAGPTVIPPTITPGPVFPTPPGGGGFKETR